VGLRRGPAGLVEAAVELRRRGHGGRHDHGGSRGHVDERQHGHTVLAARAVDRGDALVAREQLEGHEHLRQVPRGGHGQLQHLLAERERLLHHAYAWIGGHLHRERPHPTLRDLSRARTRRPRAHPRSEGLHGALHA
jgi:hypothetical protein